MRICIVGSVTVNSALSSPRGQAPLRIGGWISPTSTTSSPISSNQISAAGKRVLRASARFNGRTISASCETEEKRNIAFSRKKSHYALLGVPCDASFSDIRIAYRGLALKYYPDVMPLHQLETATDIFSEINEAYGTLSDPQKRKAYDALHLIPNFDTARAAASPSSTSFGHWRGKNWETDQCWC